MKNVVITSACRSAIGSYGRSLKNIDSSDLGSSVIESSVAKSKLKKNEIDEVILGQVLTSGLGQNPARQAAMKAGIPKETPAYVVNQVCGSGLRSVAWLLVLNGVKDSNCRRTRKYVISASRDPFKRWKKDR